METVKQLIPAFSKNQFEISQLKNAQTLEVSEFFCDTIQGEGVFAGVPAAFLRLKGCTLNCIWCDSTEIWRTGDVYGHHQLFALMEDYELIEKFRTLHYHLVITGGSPLRQQHNLVAFFHHFLQLYKFIPFIEIENECAIRPLPEMEEFVSCWNNSPKLSSSGNKNTINSEKYLRNVHFTAQIGSNSWFKFVVDCEEDWQEILDTYILSNIIQRRQIILMPNGATREELEITRPIAIKLATKYSVRYSDRLHVVAWDKKTGV